MKVDPTRAALSMLALACLAVAVVLLAIDELDGTGAATLLGLAGVFVFLAAGGQSLINRISKVGPGGIEISGDVVRHLSISSLPTDLLQPDLGPDGFELKELGEDQKWHYELGADWIMHHNHQDLPLRELPDRDLNLYREFVVAVGRLALVQGEFGYQKALYLVKRLEDVPNRTADESFLLGETYRMAYLDQATYLKSSRLFLEQSLKSDNTSARTHFSLAWVYDELGRVYDESERYQQAIAENDKALSIDPRLVPAANRNAACAFMKLNDPAQAIKRLAQIPAGPWWEETYQDGDLQSLKAGPYAQEFNRLYNERRATTR